MHQVVVVVAVEDRIKFTHSWNDANDDEDDDYDFSGVSLQLLLLLTDSVWLRNSRNSSVVRVIIYDHYENAIN